MPERAGATLMGLLPEGPFAIAGLVAIVVGLGIIIHRRDIPKAYSIGLLVVLLYGLDGVAGLMGRFVRPHELGFRAAPFLAGQEWWTPLTSIFVHADLWHLAGNLLILLTAGPALEDRIGSRRFLLIFFVAAFAALAAHVGLAYATDITSPFATALGASGGIFGVLTAFAVRYPRERLPFLMLFLIIWMPAFTVLLIYMAMQFVFALSPSPVAWWGHFAGFLVGLAFVRGMPAPPAGVSGQPASPKGLPDASRLEPLATSPDLRRIVDRLRQFTPETRTADDREYIDAWLVQFFEKARCPSCGSVLERKGLTAACATGDYTVDFARG